MKKNIQTTPNEDFEQLEKQVGELIDELLEASATGNEASAVEKYLQITRLIPSNNKLAKESLNRAILEKLSNDCSSAEDLELSLSLLKEFFDFSDKEKMHFVAKSSVEKRQIMLNKALDRVLDPNRHVISSTESFEQRLEKSYSPPSLWSMRSTNNALSSFGEIAQPVVFSMLGRGSVDKVENLLRSFPKYSDEPVQEKQFATKKSKHMAQGPFLVGQAASLLWSGSKDNNVPVKSWGGAKKILGCGIGFVLDPNKIDVLYGDFHATDSLSVITSEMIEDREQSKKDSKYEDKPQVKRTWGHSRNQKGITNYAKWIPSKNGEGFHYRLSEADAPSGLEIFAKNV